MDPIADENLLWIAYRGLTEPLPEPWEEIENSDNEIIYYNKETKEKSNVSPLDNYYKKLYLQEKAKKKKISKEIEEEKTPGYSKMVLTSDIFDEAVSNSESEEESIDKDDLEEEFNKNIEVNLTHSFRNLKQNIRGKLRSLIRKLI